jgi:hypothetical protein
MDINSDIVSAALRWRDRAGRFRSTLCHGYHETKQGERYTISESARRTVLDRLLALNHRRYEEVVRDGMDKKRGRSRQQRNAGRMADPSSTQAQLL